MRIYDLFERHPKTPPELIKSVYRLWNQGLDYKTIANRLGIKPTAVNKIILRHHKERALRRKPVNELEIQQVLALHNQRLTVAEIARKLNISWSRVSSIIKNHIN